MLVKKKKKKLAQHDLIYCRLGHNLFVRQPMNSHPYLHFKRVVRTVQGVSTYDVDVDKH